MTEAGKKDALREAVLGGTPAQRTMVFANSALAADDICALLIREGADATCYHSGVTMAERERVLARFQAGEVAVVVCTDAAARGIDVTDVGHVVQAEFVSGAVDFLHRVGRTVRSHQP